MADIPNKQSLLFGIGLTLLIALRQFMSGRFWPTLLLWILGLPVAAIFLMFNNPKEQKGINWGTVVAMPICSLIWPVLLFTLLLGKPWRDSKWVNRPARATETES